MRGAGGYVVAFASILALAVEATRPSTALGADAVDVALVLAADVSRSINEEEFELQRRGYAAAITSPRLIDTIRSGSHGAIAVSFVEWAGESEQKTVVDWTIIRDETQASAFAAALVEAPRS